MEDCILVRITNNKISVINGNIRLRALLEIDGKATVRNVETGQDLTIVLNQDNEIVEDKKDK